MNHRVIVALSLGVINLGIGLIPPIDLAGILCFICAGLMLGMALLSYGEKK